MEISHQCNLKMNITTYDPRMHKCQENYTHEDFTLDVIEEMRGSRDSGPCVVQRGKKKKSMKFLSNFIGENYEYCDSASDVKEEAIEAPVKSA